METIKIQCTNCKLDKRMGEGSTKEQFYKDGLSAITFFCVPTREFVLLQAVTSPELFKKAKDLPAKFEPAQPSPNPVEPGSKVMKWTHSSCQGELIPLTYYRAHPKPQCPICQKGFLTIKTLGYKD